MFVSKMVEVFGEVRRVLRKDGTLWLNLGDSYNANGREGHGTRTGFKQGTNRASAAGSDTCRPSADNLKPKDLIGIPWSVAFALRASGWYLRQDIIWAKPNPMPESVTDRCTKSHEYIFLMSKSPKYYFDSDAIKEDSVSKDDRKPYAPGQVDARGNGHDREGGKHTGRDASKRNKRDVWFVTPQPFRGAHFATYPPKLIEPCILAGCPLGGTVLDPFCGSGTTGVVALQHGRNFIGLELNPEYAEMSRRRITAACPDFLADL